MASISDIRNKPKFFILKKNANKENLCEICQSHYIIVAVKWGCDYIITTDLEARIKNQLKHNLHVWCVSDKNTAAGKPPTCFKEYQDAGYCNVS